MIGDDVRIGDVKTGQVVEVLDQFHVVVNRGAADGVRHGDRFLIYALGPELHDPETGDNLGKLEVVRGIAKVVHLQERMATVLSDEFDLSPPRTVKRTMSIFPQEEVVEGRRERLPLRHPEKGDFAKHVHD